MSKKRITKVYTKTGDRGITSLVFGERVSKDSKRVDAYGDVDELNSVIGIVRTRIDDRKIDGILNRIQNDLFIIGADLASTDSDRALRLKKSRVKYLEKQIDYYLLQLEPLREFILPYGSEACSVAHLARTVARRAERKVVTLMNEESLNINILVYLNRLSDLFFVIARVLNKNDGHTESYVDFSK